jgi:acid phosphatase type 7
MRAHGPLALVVILICGTAWHAGCSDSARGAAAIPASTEAGTPPVPPSEVLPGGGEGVVLVGAGDIAGCGRAFADEATAALIERIGGAVFTLGDNAYPNGRARDFACYDASWGRFKDRTYPSPGNHDYRTGEAGPYFAYFGNRAGPAGRGWYSYELGGWHIVSLNSERNLDAQATWLARDLAAHLARCTLAYWHRPLFTSSSRHSPEVAMRPLFGLLYKAGGDLVIAGHSHQYERFAPQDPEGRADSSRGIRALVVGTGGSPALYGFGPPAANSEVRYAGGQGVLKLTLYPERYEFEFVSAPGKAFSDRGAGECH